MTYKEALSYIDDLENRNLEPDHGNSVRLMEALGNPQDEMAVVHVAGTNGKGSTIAFMKHMLEAGGYSVGVCSSPYIMTPREMTEVRGEMISEEAFGDTMGRIKAACEGLVKNGQPQPTVFECLTALSLLHLAEQKLDCVLVETGMGGRFDATNVFKMPLLTVITSIDYDHQAFLGETLAEIAWHKGGIIKPEVPTVIGVNPLEVINAISDCVRITGHKLYLLDMGLGQYTSLMKTPGRHMFHLRTTYYDYKALQTSMIGEHQVDNLALALLAISKLKKHFPLDEATIKKGVKNTRWSCRNDLISSKPAILVDGGHNLAAFKAMEKLLKDYWPDHKVVTVMGLLKDKEKDSILAVADAFSDQLLVTEPVSDRRMKVTDYGSLPENAVAVPDYKEALKKGLSLSDDKTLLLLIGSLYLACPGKAWLLQQPEL